MAQRSDAGDWTRESGLDCGSSTESSPESTDGLDRQFIGPKQEGQPLSRVSLQQCVGLLERLLDCTLDLGQARIPRFGGPFYGRSVELVGLEGGRERSGRLLVIDGSLRALDLESVHERGEPFDLPCIQLELAGQEP